MKTEVCPSQILQSGCSEVLNEACNEAEKASVLLPAALMSEHKDHQQDGNNRRAAGVNQQHSVYLFTTCDGHKTEYFSFVLQIIFSPHVQKKCFCNCK